MAKTASFKNCSYLGVEVDPAVAWEQRLCRVQMEPFSSTSPRLLNVKDDFFKSLDGAHNNVREAQSRSEEEV